MKTIIHQKCPDFCIETYGQRPPEAPQGASGGAIYVIIITFIIIIDCSSSSIESQHVKES